MKTKLNKNSAILSFIILFMTFGNIPSTGKPAVDKFEGMIILKVSDPTTKLFEKIQDKISKDHTLSLDYQCAETGILVIKFTNSGFSMKADNSKNILNYLSKILKDHETTILFESTTPQDGSSRC